MKQSEKIIALTNKFLEEFFEQAAKDAAKEDDDENVKRDDSFHFHYTLADAIGQSNYPRDKKDEQLTLLMGMSSFDDSMAKVMFNERIQGFVKIIEDALACTEEQDDYRIENVRTEKFLKDDHEFIWSKDTKPCSFKMIPCKTEVDKTEFDVINSRSGFEGRVVVFKEMEKIFINKNDYNEVLTVDHVDFYVKDVRVMTINYKQDFDTGEFHEEGTFTHYKYIAKINSFYTTIKFR